MRFHCSVNSSALLNDARTSSVILVIYHRSCKNVGQSGRKFMCARYPQNVCEQKKESEKGIVIRQKVNEMERECIHIMYEINEKL